ncbi:hypothetical protein HPB49_015813 [Dermacentor silvarum]|uniref:Uncharacterized protein n=1 Tax=Dermacentor silvarum TaxID=543639 RepID=A0ACB8DIZ5_DERSI|nr:hypothetical protein HPB49_015813 [Dermacentor silvarum]
MLVELKNGETYNGHLVSCDNWMNINLREVICTSRDGDKFWRMPECYIRGSTIKYLRIPDEVIDMVKEETLVKGRGRGDAGKRGGPGGRGGRGGRGVMEMAEEAAAKEAGAEGVAVVVQISLAMAQVLPEQTHFRELGSKTATIIVYIATM